jgi:hypothetical protein
LALWGKKSKINNRSTWSTRKKGPKGKKSKQERERERKAQQCWILAVDSSCSGWRVDRSDWDVTGQDVVK